MRWPVGLPWVRLNRGTFRSLYSIRHFLLLWARDRPSQGAIPGRYNRATEPGSEGGRVEMGDVSWLDSAPDFLPHRRDWGPFLFDIAARPEQRAVPGRGHPAGAVRLALFPRRLLKKNEPRMARITRIKTKNAVHYRCGLRLLRLSLSLSVLSVPSVVRFSAVLALLCLTVSPKIGHSNLVPCSQCSVSSAERHGTLATPKLEFRKYSPTGGKANASAASEFSDFGFRV